MHDELTGGRFSFENIFPQKYKVTAPDVFGENSDAYLIIIPLYVAFSLCKPYDSSPYSFFLCVYLFILFLAVLGLCCCMWAFASYSKQGLLCSCGVRVSLVTEPSCRAGGFQQLWRIG